MPISKERLAELEAMPDEAIDASDLPELDEAFFRDARLVMPAGSKRSLTLRVDEDVVAWFRSGGRGHLTRMNAVLRAYMLRHQEDASSKQG